MNIKKIHLISGCIITLFIGLHLYNHLCSIVGVQHHIETMHVLRNMYRNTFVETALLLAVLIQIISGITLYRTGLKNANTWFERLHIWSGLYLALFLIIHVSAVVAGRYLLHLDTNFYFGVAGINSFPLNLFFIPYYALAIISFFAHIASVHQKKMKYAILHCTPQQQAKAILILGCVITMVIFYGLTNQFKGVNIPGDYHIIIGK